MESQNNILENIKKWHSLTEIPTNENHDIENAALSDVKTDKSAQPQSPHTLLTGVSAELTKILWDILVYPYSSVSVRIKRLNLSARSFEKAKHEGLEKGFFTESSAGQTIYLIPTKKTFKAFNMPCLYEREVSIEHAYYVLWTCFLVSKDPRYKSVLPEVKLGSSGSTSDVVTTAHDGTRQAWEITLSTTNILSNAAKYENAGFAIIIFLCRDYKLKEAVKACCREGGLNPDLLAKLEYMHFSQLLRRQRKLSLY